MKTHPRLFRLLTLFTLLAAFLALIPLHAARAADLTVTNNADSGAGALRDTILFDVSLSGATIHFASYNYLGKDLNIDG
ncbi:MAG: hypothetical protein H6636_03825 [Anaerolineales bacterium]|nr:hypothetical protein [Anaerolineales bacterium]